MGVIRRVLLPEVAVAAPPDSATVSITEVINYGDNVLVFSEGGLSLRGVYIPTSIDEASNSAELSPMNGDSDSIEVTSENINMVRVYKASDSPTIEFPPGPLRVENVDDIARTKAALASLEIGKPYIVGDTERTLTGFSYDNGIVTLDFDGYSRDTKNLGLMLDKCAEAQTISRSSRSAENQISFQVPKVEIYLEQDGSICNQFERLSDLIGQEVSIKVNNGREINIEIFEVINHCGEFYISYIESESGERHTIHEKDLSQGNFFIITRKSADLSLNVPGQCSGQPFFASTVRFDGLNSHGQEKVYAFDQDGTCLTGDKPRAVFFKERDGFFYHDNESGKQLINPFLFVKAIDV